MDKAVNFCCSLLRGAGQVMFMEDGLTGTLFLAGILVGSWLSGTAIMAVGAVVGVVVSTFAGSITQEDGRQGLHGFNGILVGCALATFFESSWQMWAALTAHAALTPFVRLAMNKALKPLGITSLTFPFIVLTWFAFCLGLSPAGGTPPSLILNLQLPIVLSAWLNGVSQIFLVCSPLCGLLFLAGLLVADRRAAAWCAVGSAIGLALAFVCGKSLPSIQNGLYGFNPALTAIALGAVFRKSLPMTLAGIFATFFIQIALTWLLSKASIPCLTAPFCLATWTFVMKMKQRKTSIGGGLAYEGHADRI